MLLYGAEKPAETEALARGLYRATGRAPQDYRFLPQPITEVSAPQGAIYRIVLRRLPSATS